MLHRLPPPWQTQAMKPFPRRGTPETRLKSIDSSSVRLAVQWLNELAGYQYRAQEEETGIPEWVDDTYGEFLGSFTPRPLLYRDVISVSVRARFQIATSSMVCASEGPVIVPNQPCSPMRSATSRLAG